MQIELELFIVFLEMMDFQNSLLLLSICLVSFLFVKAIFTITNKKHLPPSPPALPVVGHLHLLGRIPHQALHKLSCRYGPVLYLFFGSKPCVVISSQEMAIQFLKNHESSFLNRSTRINVNYLTYGSSDFTFAPYGSYWKFLKKLCMTELLGGRTLDLHRPVRQQEMRLFIERIHRRAVVGAEIDVGDELLKLMNNMISMMILRRRCLEREDVSKLVKEMTELSGKLNISDMIWFCKNLDLQGFGKRVKDVRNRYDVLMEKIIKEHEEERKWKKGIGGEEEEVKDLLDILLDIYEDKSSAVKLTRENIKAFVMNLFGAGTDTSAVTIEWTLAELINNPNLMEKARKEIDDLTKKSRIIEETDIPNLPYLQAIVKETLRLHPTGPLIVRQATEDCNVNGYHIPDKSRLLVNVWAIGRDPKNWENPLEFKPERFFNEKKNNFDQLLSFGSGRRSCPGASLALQVIPTVVGAMIQCFEWKVEGFVLDMEEAPGISLPRAHPLVSIPLPRLNPFPLTSLC